MTERKRDAELVGFYAEIPRSLMTEFTELFPAKGSKRIALIAALKTFIEQEKNARPRTGLRLDP